MDFCTSFIITALTRGDVKRVRRALTADPVIMHAVVTCGDELPVFTHAVRLADKSKCKTDDEFQRRRQIVEMMLTARADVNVGRSWNARRVPVEVVRDAQLARQLLDHKADITCREGGYSPLGQAALGRKTQVVEVFLDAGADATIEKFFHDPANTYHSKLKPVRKLIAGAAWRQWQQVLRLVLSQDTAGLVTEYLMARPVQ